MDALCGGGAGVCFVDAEQADGDVDADFSGDHCILGNAAAVAADRDHAGTVADFVDGMWRSGEDYSAGAGGAGDGAVDSAADCGRCADVLSGEIDCAASAVGGLWETAGGCDVQ